MVNCIFLSIIVCLSIYLSIVYLPTYLFYILVSVSFLATNYLLVSKNGYEFRIERNFFSNFKATAYLVSWQPSPAWNTKAFF